jgi:hypothetical protein
MAAPTVACGVGVPPRPTPLVPLIVNGTTIAPPVHVEVKRHTVAAPGMAILPPNTPELLPAAPLNVPEPLTAAAETAAMGLAPGSVISRYAAPLNDPPSIRSMSR